MSAECGRTGAATLPSHAARPPSRAQLQPAKVATLPTVVSMAQPPGRRVPTAVVVREMPDDDFAAMPCVRATPAIIPAAAPAKTFGAMAYFIAAALNLEEKLPNLSSVIEEANRSMGVTPPLGTTWFEQALELTRCLRP